ncbi:MAG: acetylxylan esterase [Bryobacterales bacterium]|nr:acetylxylan esterase [Bryobacterales bacterium]
MRLPWLILLALMAQATLPAQDTSGDARNTDPPNTDTHFRMPAYRSLEEWRARAAHLRKQILSAAGLLPMPAKNPLNPRIFGRIENQDYSIENVHLETLPGYYLGGNLYRPLGKTGRFPGVASPHGHWNYGRLEHQPLGSIPSRAINLARQGYVVFAYDMVGYNDTVQTPHAFGGPREQLWSFGPLGLQLWNSIRVVDFLQSLPDVDPDRIAATGASGGGTQTFLLTAVDDRVKVSAPVNMISAIMQGGSPCENAPNLRVNAFNVEFGAMAAPRPLLMVSATGDWTRNTPKEEFPAIQGIYSLFGKPDMVETVLIDAPHNYNQQSREAVYRFFAKHLLGDRDAGKYAEKPVRIEKLQDMLVLHGRTLPHNALPYERLFEQWISAARAQSEETTDPSELRERLQLVLAPWPREVLSREEGGRIVLSRPGRGDRVSGIYRRAAGPATLIVHPEGAEAAPKFAPPNGAVLMIDAFQTGRAAAPRDRSHTHFLAFNQTDDANRAVDILTALAFLKQTGATQVKLRGIGKAGLWCLFAAAAAETPVQLEADLDGFQGTDREFIDRFFVPGIQRAGGLRAARIAAGLR